MFSNSAPNIYIPKTWKIKIICYIKYEEAMSEVNVSEKDYAIEKQTKQYSFCS